MAEQTGSITLAPLEPSARYSLRLRTAAAAELQASGALPLDFAINTCRTDRGRILARLGPDEWLMLGAEREHDEIDRELTAALAGTFHSRVDISHRNIGIAVAGTYAREVLNGDCPLNLSEETFPPYSATRTVLGKSEILLLRPGPEAFYRVECWRSFAPYVHALLAELAWEFSDSSS